MDASNAGGDVRRLGWRAEVRGGLWPFDAFGIA